jgi:hypothetical protein
MFKNIIETFAGKGQRAPRPSVGECTNTGEWPDNKMVDDCLKCVSKPGWYGEKQFYCNGKCMSEYNTAQHCSQNSLVAKIEGQCMAPCRQVGAPRAGGGCSDKFDCASGMICVSGNCKPAPVTQAPVTQAPVFDPNVSQFVVTTPAPVFDPNVPQFNVESYGDYDYALDMYSAKGNFDKMYIGVL